MTSVVLTKLEVATGKELLSRHSGRFVSAVLVLLLLAGYLPVFALYAREHWDAANLQGAYAHAPLALALILFLIWHKRQTLIEPGPVVLRFSGVLGLTLGAFLKIYGDVHGYVALQGMSLIPLLLGLLLIRHSTAAWNAMRFPVLFLIFVIPVPNAAIDALTRPLVMATGDLVIPILSALMLDVSLAGQTLTVSAASSEEIHGILLAPECSGIRSLVALLALGSLFAHLKEHTWWRAGAMLMMTVPLILCSNAIRVALTILLIVYVDPEAAEGFTHQLSGFLLFALTLLGFFVTDRLLGLANSGKPS